ncbi:hypothetical protein QUF55_04040 [Clostridiaceae bacterium HSG29]|nr:hypothetical protein [Clostridiaceae bacterium HSG29]
MKIDIIGTESLGVRGLSVVVKLNNRKIFIDPGIALGYLRRGLSPHPVQVGVGKIIKERIINELKDTTDIVFSHFHGDHIPFLEANPYQLSIDEMKEIKKDCNIWMDLKSELSVKMEKRRTDLILAFKNNILDFKENENSFFTFSNPVPHGENNTHSGTVTMTKIIDNEFIFVHASDIQFSLEETVDRIIEYKPNLVLASGPPIYLESFMKNKLDIALKNIIKLSNEVDTLIIDHHFLRNEEGIEYLIKLSKESKNEIVCAADYMQINKHLLEAKRTKFHEDIPVEEDFQELYFNNETDVKKYMSIAKEKYKWFQY